MKAVKLIQLFLFILLACSTTTLARRLLLQDEENLPYLYPPTVVEGSQQVCPPTQQRAAIRESIEGGIQAILQNVSCFGTARRCPATNCSSLHELDPTLPSGYYWVTNSSGSAIRVLCDMTREGCNGTRGWTRVAFLNTSDPTQQCPSGWREITSPRRTCGRSTDVTGCDSAIFNTSGIQYSAVLGRVLGYQYGNPEGFGEGGSSIDTGKYLDGVSITCGLPPRQHIWSLAAEKGDNVPDCPCDDPAQSTPSFVGENYFCEAGTAVNDGQVIFREDDPLWDGQGCGTSTCCRYNNPPWFCRQLSEATTDYIEVRLCGHSGLLTNEDIPIEVVEIYVQ